MEPVTLKALFHRRMECIGIFYARETSLEKIIRRQPNVKWSKTYACWYIPLTAEAYQILMRDLGGKATVDNRALRTYLEQRKQPASTIPEKHPAIAKTPRPAPTGIDKAAMKLSAENTEALRKFVELLKLKGYSASTIRTYRNEFTQLLQLLNLKPVAELTADELKRYMAFIMDKQGLSENTAHSRLNALKFYFEQVLGREKFFYEIPRPKKWKKLPKVISEEKILEGLLKVQNLKHKTLLLLAYSAGMRVSEVIQLKITDIDSDRMQVRINHAKGKKDRVVTLSSGLLPILRDYYVAYKPKSWLFEGQYHGEHISSRTAQTVFKEAYKNLGLPPQCSFHSLRHSYATHLLESGTDISYIQKLLGHQDIKTTLIYTQVSNKEIGKIESPLDRALRKLGK